MAKKVVKRTKSVTKKLPSLKKDVKDFLLNEEGKITKKDIAKMGLTLAALSLMFPSQASAQSTHTYGSDEGGHNSHGSHGSHGSHSSHSHGAW